MHTADKLNKIMEQIRSLLAVADHPNTNPAESDAFRTRAESLMLKYRIEESQISTEEKALAGIKPVKRSWRIARYDSEFRNSQWSLAVWAVCHVDGRFSQRTEWEGNVAWVVMDVYGFESDVMYAEMIFTASRVTFSARLEPSVNPHLSEAENCYRLRAAGMEKHRVANAVFGAALDNKSAAIKVGRLYKEECARRGEEAVLNRQGKGASTYRRSFAEAFTNGIYSRLLNLRIARSADSAGELVLASRKSEVDELYYQDHEWARPKVYTEEERQEQASARANRKVDGRKLRARKYQERPSNWQAALMGRDAASRVDLTGGNFPKSRMQERNNANLKEIGD